MPSECTTGSAEMQQISEMPHLSELLLLVRTYSNEMLTPMERCLAEAIAHWLVGPAYLRMEQKRREDRCLESLRSSKHKPKSDPASSRMKVGA